MQKPERLLKILTLLQSRRRAITACELAEHLQVSERTIYRDMQSLSLSGVPIDGEVGVGYLLQKGALLAPLSFNEDELEALILGVRMVHGWGDKGLGKAADSAVEKIRSILPDRMHYLHSMTEETLLVPNFEQAQSTRFSQVLREAIKGRYKVTIDYKKENGDASCRLLWPFGLVYWGKVWTLISWCELRESYRVFRLDRITDLVTEGPFEPSESRNLRHYLERYGDCSGDFLS